MDHARIGIIGGSGLYQMEALKEVREVVVATPFGAPSGPLTLGTLEGVRVAFLARHGKGHALLPSEINYRANLFAMKKLGVERILSVGAVGSMKEEIAPGHVVIPDQFYDLTRSRQNTFFGKGVVAHASLAHPVCAQLAEIAAASVTKAAGIVHRGGTYLCMEGPQFSTRAESDIYRQWGVSIIGMTNATEAKLAREAEMCYATIALSTDYDCWHQTEKPVTVDAVLEVLHKNVTLAKRLLQMAITEAVAPYTCGCGVAMQYAILTASHLIPKRTKQALRPLIGKYMVGEKP